MKRAINAVLIVFLACLTCVGCSGSPRNSCDDPCGKPTVWDEYNDFELKVTGREESGYSFWKWRYDKESGDIQIDVNTSDGTKVTRGKILMVGGLAMATQGPVTKTGYEIDSLDAPVLYQTLVLRLLGQTLPNGPAKIHEARKIDFENTKTGIQYATKSAHGIIAAPWHVIGNVKIVASDVIEYELSLTAPTGDTIAGHDKEYVTNFSGRLSKIASAKIKDTVQLDGWKLFEVGPHTRKQGSITIYDYDAVPSSMTFKNIADLRKSLKSDPAAIQ